jgi:replicative DNA helicase
VTLVDVITAYGHKLVQRGNDLWCKCPWHEDTNPSFSVSQKGDHWEFYCFSCKRGGGAVSFVAFSEGITRRAARRILAEMSGQVLSVDPDLEVMDKVATYAAGAIDDPVFREYARSRGWPMETVRSLQVGYCGSVQSMLEEMEVEVRDAERLGLLGMDRSVVFPFFSDDGCVKVQTRSVDEKAYRFRGKNVPMLWGLDSVRSQTVYPFEGPGDVIVGRSKGIPCVAMCGTDFHEEFWNQLRVAEVREVVFVPDGDEGGRSFFRRMVDKFDPSFSVGYSVIAGDPDEWLRDRELPAPVHPVIWWCENKQHPRSEHEKMLLYSELAPLVCRLPAAHREVISPWMRTRYGDDAVDFLRYDVPADLASERVVLANCLCSEQIAWETIAALGEGCFHGRDHLSVWDLVRSEERPTIQLVKSMTGLDYSESADIINYQRYVDRVRWVGASRRAAAALDRARSEVTGATSEAIVGRVIEELHQVSDGRSSVISGREVALKVKIDLDEKVRNPSVLGVPMNEDRFPILGRSLLGYVPGKFILLSGPTGHGKTTMACNMIDDLVFERGVSIGLVTLEMTPEELIQKQVAIRSGVSGTKIITGSVTQEEYDKVSDSMGRVITELGEKIQIVYGVYDLHRIVSIVKSLIMRQRVRVVFVDYLQLIAIASRKDRWEQLMEITKALKTQVCSMGVTVVGLSQLSKAALRSDVPEAADQSGSYGMLADADVAITVRKRTGTEVRDGSNFLIFVDKHRYGVDSVLIDAVFNKTSLTIQEVRR